MINRITFPHNAVHNETPSKVYSRTGFVHPLGKAFDRWKKPWHIKTHLTEPQGSFSTEKLIITLFKNTTILANCFFWRTSSTTYHFPPIDKAKQEYVSVHSKLDYCYSLYHNLPKSQITRLQQIQNYLARAVVKPSKSSHITPILPPLHWLKITEHNEYKLLSDSYKVLTTTQSSYLHNLMIRVAVFSTTKYGRFSSIDPSKSSLPNMSIYNSMHVAIRTQITHKEWTLVKF